MALDKKISNRVTPKLTVSYRNIQYFMLTPTSVCLKRLTEFCGFLHSLSRYFISISGSL